MNDINDDVTLLIESAKRDGVATSTVSDGHLILMRKDRLRALLEENDSELVMILVKTEPDPADRVIN